MVSMANPSGGVRRRTSQGRHSAPRAPRGSGGDNTGYGATSGPDWWASSRPQLVKRPPTRHSPPTPRTTTARLHFHHSGCRISGISDWWRIRRRRRKPGVASSLEAPSYPGSGSATPEGNSPPVSMLVRVHYEGRTYGG